VIRDTDDEYAEPAAYGKDDFGAENGIRVAEKSHG
jgi:hypothetical protein